MRPRLCAPPRRALLRSTGHGPHANGRRCLCTPVVVAHGDGEWRCDVPVRTRSARSARLHLAFTEESHPTRHPGWLCDHEPAFFVQSRVPSRLRPLAQLLDDRPVHRLAVQPALDGFPSSRFGLVDCWLRLARRSSQLDCEQPQQSAYERSTRRTYGIKVQVQWRKRGFVASRMERHSTDKQQ